MRRFHEGTQRRERASQSVSVCVCVPPDPDQLSQSPLSPAHCFVAQLLSNERLGRLNGPPAEREAGDGQRVRPAREGSRHRLVVLRCAGVLACLAFTACLQGAMCIPHRMGRRMASRIPQHAGTTHKLPSSSQRYFVMPLLDPCQPSNYSIDTAGRCSSTLPAIDERTALKGTRSTFFLFGFCVRGERIIRKRGDATN